MKSDDETTLSISRAGTDLGFEVEPEMVATLVVMCGDQVGRRYLIRERAILGRTAQSTVYVPDPQISRNHAELIRDATGEYLVIDLNSRNGTLVNGVAITTHHLALGDQIQIGGTGLLFTRRDPGVEQLLQRQKLEALGRIGAGIAHDFNNLLGAVMASLDYLGTLPKDKEIADPDVRECLDDIRTAGSRASDLSRRLLGFARHNTQAFGSVDLTSICEEVVHLSQRTFMRSIRVSSDIIQGLTVTGDRVQLHQMLMNLTINARDAMPEGGNLKVSAKLYPAPETLPKERLAEACTHAQIVITDSGHGMDEVTKKRAFDPFYTTKRADKKGSGLGLATVLEVVTAHGGRISMDTAIGQGTMFTITLPLGKPIQRVHLRETVSRQSAPPLPPPSRDQCGLILLVEDEVILSRSTRRLLEQAGHEVVAKNSGKEAVAWFKSTNKTPDLLLLDMNMPEMSGAETYRAIRRVNASARAVVYSGYWTPEEEVVLRSEGVLDFIQKPFDASTLREAVSNALQKKFGETLTTEVDDNS